MKEIYSCPDGREVLLTFYEDALTVVAESRGGISIGRFWFDLLDSVGEPLAVIESTEAIHLQLVAVEIDEAWKGQGLEERVTCLVNDKTGLSDPR